jgi:membrane protein implicated in regulation of membrane protease activity
MLDYFSANLWQLWAILAVVCLIVELMTGGFFIICFAIGAVAAALTTLFGGLALQVVVFIIFSAVSVFMVRPFALRYLHENKPAPVSNADALLGRVGRVSETIVAGGFGRVAIDGDDWKAQATGTDTDIAEGSLVQVTGRESIIIDVEPVKKVNA